MDILTARKEVTSKPKKADLDKLIDTAKTKGEDIFYFDKENSHKDMMSVVDKFEEEGFSVHFREVKYGLADDEYIYELHAL